jgi:hypothetical protein
MANKQNVKRLEQKVVRKAKIVGNDVKKGATRTRAELAKGSKTIGRGIKRTGKTVGRDLERGGKRISAATRQRMTRASTKIRSYRVSRTKKA